VTRKKRIRRGKREEGSEVEEWRRGRGAKRKEEISKEEPEEEPTNVTAP
jgi:hypothetical protein